MDRFFAIIVALVALLCASCRPPVQAPATRARVERVVVPRREPPAPRTPVEWQGALLVADAEGPTLFRQSRPSSRGYAWIVAGTPLIPRGDVQRGRVRVHLDGPLMVRGWIPVDRLEAIVLSRGRIRGTPLYVVPGDRVRLIEASGSTATIEASAHLGHPELGSSPSFRGVFPLSHLGADSVGAGAGATSGSSVLLRRARALYAAPNGDVVWEIPALAAPLPATVLREEGEWLGVRIGVGPYLVGYVSRSSLEGGANKKDGLGREVIDPWAQDEHGPVEERAEIPDPWAAEGHAALPPLLMRAAVRPVWHVRAGTRVRVDGATVAIFREAGRAVEIGRAGTDVVVLGAVDENVTVQGSVRPEDLEALR